MGMEARAVRGRRAPRRRRAADRDRTAALGSASRSGGRGGSARHRSWRSPGIAGGLHATTRPGDVVVASRAGRRRRSHPPTVARARRWSRPRCGATASTVHVGPARVVGPARARLGARPPGRPLGRAGRRHGVGVARAGGRRAGRSPSCGPSPTPAATRSSTARRCGTRGARLASLRAVTPGLERWAAARAPRRRAPSSSPARGRSAPASNGRSRPSSGPSTASAPPVYVRRQIVHNTHVVDGLEARGAVFVEELDEVPVGSTVVLAAHGVAPAVHDEAAERRSARHRRDLPAGGEGPPRGPALRGQGLRDRAARPRRARGDRRHARRGARRDPRRRATPTRSTPCRSRPAARSPT